MPALPNGVLRAKLAGALPEGSSFTSGPEDVHPALANVTGFGRARFYVWTVTADRSVSGRPAGEFKIQLILPNQSRQARASLEIEGPYTVLLGYSPDDGVFVGWEAPLYRRFAYSRNVQCREELLREARSTGWGVAEPRRVSGAEEVRVAFTPGNLLHYLRTSRAADAEGRKGKWREAFFLAHTPNAETPPPVRSRDLDEYVRKQRGRVTATRLARDGRFSALIKIQYAYACAVCAVQLEIVEGAHIIPVREAGSSDDVWNGVALCPNHHDLFDGSAFLIRPDLEVRVDQERVEYFRANDLAQGLEILTDYDRRRIRAPEFWKRSADLQGRMVRALTRRAAAAGLT